MKLQTPSKKIILQIPLEKIGVNQVQIPSGATITAVKASQNNHTLNLYVLVDQSTRETSEGLVAVIPAGQTFEVEDELNFIGSDWVKDVYCTVFWVSPKSTNPVDPEEFNSDDDEQAVEPDSSL